MYVLYVCRITPYVPVQLGPKHARPIGNKDTQTPRVPTYLLKPEFHRQVKKKHARASTRADVSVLCIKKDTTNLSFAQ